MSTSRMRSPLIVALGWALASTALCAAVIPLEPNQLEEGLILHVVQRMLRGEHLFRDVISFTGPLPFDALALLFRIFGEEILVGRTAIAVLCGVCGAATYDLARRAGAGALAHAAAACVAFAPILLFPLLSIYFYTTIAVSLSMLAAYATLRGGESLGWAFCAGLLIAAVALCKQTVGAVLALTLLLAFAACTPSDARLKRISAVVAGGALATLLTLGSAALRSDLGVLVHSLVTLPLSFTSTYSVPFMNFWPPGQFSADVYHNKFMYVPYLYSLPHSVFDDVPWPMVLFTQLLYALPFAAVVATLLARVRGPLPSACWIWLACLLALTSNLFPRTDWGHIVYVLPTAAVQLLLLWPEGRRRVTRFAWRPVSAGVLIVALGAGSALAVHSLYERAGPARFGPKVPLRPVSGMHSGDAVPRVIEYIRSRVKPGEPIFVARSEPLIYFATETTNPTAYSGVVPGMREEQERDILEGLEKVRFVVMSEIDQPLYTYYSQELPDVQRYLERHFELPRIFRGHKNQSWIVVLERRADRGATAVDLIEALPSAKRWIRTRAGSRVPAPESPPVLASRHNRRPLAMLLGPRGGGIDFELEVPPDAHFQADVGWKHMLGASARYTHHDSGSMSISIRGADEGASFEQLRSLRIPWKRGATHAWLPIDLDLSKWGGQRVTLRLQLIPDRLVEEGRMAWWGSPRIALEPEPPRHAAQQKP